MIEAEIAREIVGVSAGARPAALGALAHAPSRTDRRVGHKSGVISGAASRAGLRH